MAFEIVMPQLGWFMEEGILVEWLKNEGEEVAVGEPLLTVEGDKVLQEVESLESGVLHILPDAPSPGEKVKVGVVLAYLVQPGEAIPFTASPTREDVVPSAPLQEPVLSNVREGPKESPTAPTERRVGSKVAISPRARRIAIELGVDWENLKGSGSSGRIVERDIRQAAQTKARGAMTQTAAPQVKPAIVDRPVLGIPPATTPPRGGAVPITQMRRTIAEHMAKAAHTTAPVTLNTEADATELVEIREQIKASFAPHGRHVPSYNDLMVKLVACALEEHPTLNASWGENEILVFQEIHIAVAIDTEAGLIVPVVRDVAHKSVLEIAEESRDLAQRARARKLGLHEITGGTFTVTNLGMYGIDAFSPIINLPQCAILGVGRIVKKPAEWQDQIALRQMMTLSLTFDHRVVDGAPAARFLNTVREYVEQPYSWLVR